MAKLIKKTKGRDLTKERLDKMTPIAAKILSIIAEAKLPMGELRENDQFNAVAKDVLELLLENDVKYVDKEFVFQLVGQPLEQVKNIVLQSLAHSFDQVLNRALSKEFRELTLGDMDRTLKS